MELIRFRFDLMIPLEYKKEKFSDLCNGQIPEMGEWFKQKKIRSQRLNDAGKDLLNENENAVVQCYELNQKSRLRIGLHKNENYSYRVCKRNKEYNFHIGKIKAWFFQSGNAFLTVHIHTEEIEKKDALNLKSFLVDIRSRKEIRYQYSTGKNEYDTGTFTLRILMDKFTEMCGFLQAKYSSNRFSKAYSLTYGLVESMEEPELAELLKMLRLNRNAGMKSDVNKESDYVYKPFDYIYWAVSENSLSMIGDCNKARTIAAGNEQFLKAGLQDSVFQNYILLYLYYIDLYITCDKTKRYCDAVMKKDNKIIDQNIVQSLMRMDNHMERLSTEDHINTLFLEYLCNKGLGLQKMVNSLHEEYLPWAVKNSNYSIFISYRREGGFYPARLLYAICEQNKKRPFIDVERLHSGAFDQQLYRVIEQCNNVIVVLSPGCLDRCMEEEDWVRKEISYAMECGKNIIPVLLEGFEYPKELPECMKDFEKINGITSNPQHFSDVIRKIMEFLK